MRNVYLVTLRWIWTAGIRFLAVARGFSLLHNVQTGSEAHPAPTQVFFFFLVAPTLGNLLPLLEHRAEFHQFLDQGQSVGLLGRVISSSQGLYLYTSTEKRTYTNTKHPCPE
jgi:hypothetical protein